MIGEYIINLIPNFKKNIRRSSDKIGEKEKGKIMMKNRKN